jgi:hypothetical protein
MKYFQERMDMNIRVRENSPPGSAGADWNQWAWIWPIIMVRFILTEQRKEANPGVPAPYNRE